MEKARKWSVTYTKHVKQKRKVYQDGILQLDSSGHKVILYDDCEQLLDSRFLKLDDIVKPGETITFGAYLVDIGDPDGDCKPTPTLNFQERDAKIVNRGKLLHANKLTDSTCTGNRKNAPGWHKTILSNLSPSQKIIREFKKTEVKKYEASASSPDTINENITEWQVLYTTQITKKAKTYHDGSLKLTIRGSHARQATLYDETGRLLNSRFLKKDEMVNSGESLSFEGHLVDIGECVGDPKPPTELNVQGRNCSAFQRGVVHREQSQACNKLPLGCFNAECDAMYTTQITQKSKKYHDEATLLSEDGIILGRKSLNLSEDISSGSKFQLPKYLVEIGEPRRHREGDQNEASVSKYKDVKVGCSATDNTKLNMRVPANRSLREPQDIASPLNDTKSKIRSSGADKIISSGKVVDNKPLRNAHAILSILKRPNILEGVTNVEGESLKQGLASESSGFTQFDIQNHVHGKSVQDSCRRKIKIQDCKEENFMMHNSNGNASEKLVHIDRSVETIVSEKINNREHGRPCDASKGNEKIGDLTEVLFTKPASNLILNVSTEEVKHGDSKQESCGDNKDTISTDCMLPNHVDVERQSSPQQINTTIIDEFPSFDLGF